MSLIASVVTLFYSCKEKEEREDVLSKKEMVQVLSQIYVIEDKVNRLSLDRDSAQVVFNELMIRLRDSTGVSDSVLKRSLKYYTDRPDQMQEVYTALVDSLNLREQRSTVSN